jgi:hypothetical protein
MSRRINDISARPAATALQIKGELAIKMEFCKRLDDSILKNFLLSIPSGNPSF